MAAFTGANILHGIARAGQDGLTEIVLTTGETIFSADAAVGQVEAVVYPWEISVGRVTPARLGTERAPYGEIRSIVHVGNRVRVRIGPVSAEVTATSVEKLELAVGIPAVTRRSRPPAPGSSARTDDRG